MSANKDKDGDVIMTSGQTPGGSTDEVDEKLYSRQLYVMGIEAMKRMQHSKVLIVGMNGIGVEIAKNVILAGIKKVSILDETVVSISDLSSQFYLQETDVKNHRTRASACVNQLQELNRHVTVTNVAKELTPRLLQEGDFQVVVLVNYPLQDQIKYGDVCHELGIKFIATEGLGVFGYVFVDFGDEFIVQDDNGEQPQSGMITHISKATPGVVQVHEDQRHGLESGDWVRFEEIKGMTELNSCDAVQIKVLTPFTFEIGDTSKFSEYKGEGLYFQVKKPKRMTFSRLHDQLTKPSFLPSDFTKDSNQHHIFYQALCAFRQKNGRFPQPTSGDDANAVVQIAKQIENAEEGKSSLNEKILFGLARCSSAVINPMASFLGGVVGQEVLKSCTGKFTPIHQILYFDAFEALPSADVPLTQYAPLNCRYDDNIAVFGKDLQEKISNSKMFLVGAGAIGCEMLKNWALMGVGCGEEGQIWVTDMDTIETSNLNRQFLFRTKDVGSPKSITAADAVKAMNSEMKIIPQQNRVGEQTESVYNDFFWFNLTSVCTALDNVQARLYVDAQCVNYKKPLLESGTLGTKGNTQIVVPSLTESYGSTRDPPEKDIPICTLKNFPNKIEHTIQWARDDFEGTFKTAPQEVNRYVSEDKYLSDLAKDNSNELTTLQNLNEYLVTDKPLKFDDCIQWARLKFEKEYNHRINQLLHNFPKDSVSSDGVPFWSGPKRAPEPIEFDEKDPTHLQYIVAAGNLRAQLYGLKGTTDESVVSKALRETKVPKFQPKVVKIASNDEEAKEMKETEQPDDYDEQVQRLTKSLPKRSDLSGYRLNPIDFEKDDDTNFHMDYITACSNLRARNYKIKESNKHETKGIAGKIIPAIATTTALVTGLISFEFYKLLQPGKVIEDYRNAYVNLALPLYAMSEPAPCGKRTIKVKDSDWSYSLWDKIEIDNGKNMRLKDLIDYFQEQWGLELTMLSYGSAILYAFFHAEDKKEKRKEAKLRKLVEAVTNEPVPTDKKYLLFEVSLTNPTTDEDVEVPTVRFDISS